MRNYKDYVIFILVLLLAWFYTANNTKIVSRGSDYKQLAENTVRADSVIVAKIEVPKMNIPKIENAIAAGTITNKVSGKLQGNSSTKPYSTAKRKDINWVSGSGINFPVATAIYFPDKGRWHAIAYGLSFETNIVQQLKYDGTYETYVESWAKHNNLKEEHGGNVLFPLEISKSIFQIKENKELTFSFWNPTISGGGSFTKDTISFLLKYNVLNYGYNKQLPIYSFLSPTLNSSGDLGLEFASINIGEYLPIIKDSHIGVGIQANSNPFLSLTSVF